MVVRADKIREYLLEELCVLSPEEKFLEAKAAGLLHALETELQVHRLKKGPSYKRLESLRFHSHKRYSKRL